MKIDARTRARLGYKSSALMVRAKHKAPARNGRGRTIGEQIQALVLRARRLEKDMFRHAKNGRTAKADRLAKELVRVRESALALMSEAERRSEKIVLNGISEHGGKIPRPCSNPAAYAKAKGIKL